jgi:cytochrome c-type biogenesis protein
MRFSLFRDSFYKVPMASDVTLSAAAAAGLLSFLSPCVLPLVPPYLTFIAGTTIEDVAYQRLTRARRDIFLAAILFVLGFSTVFVALGATASVFGQVLRAHIATLSIVAGLAIILMGLHFLGLFRLAFLYREKRAEVSKPLGLWGAYLMGLAFAFGWTPCIGPILAAILAIAASEQTASRGAGLLAVYSIGLGVPFLLAAAALEPFIGFLKKFRAYFGIVERVVGVLLVVTGISFLTGAMQNFSFWLLQMFPGLANIG